MAAFNYYRYTLDSGTFVAVKTLTDLAGVAALGFAAVSAADPEPRRGFRPRKVYSLDPATGRKRADVVATPAAFAALTAGGVTLSLPERGAIIDTVWNVSGGRSEKAQITPHLIH